MRNLAGKKILVGVTGGIAAYRSCRLVNTLIKNGAEVKVMMTSAAKQFVGELTFQALVNAPVYSDLWTQHHPDSVEHISIAHWPNLILIAPATANTIAKIAHGSADNFLTTAVLAAKPEVPIVLVPAMNTCMWENPITQRNLTLLIPEARYIVIAPREGTLACRDVGAGIMAKEETILAALEGFFSKQT